MSDREKKYVICGYEVVTGLIETGAHPLERGQALTFDVHASAVNGPHMEMRDVVHGSNGSALPDKKHVFVGDKRTFPSVSSGLSQNPESQGSLLRVLFEKLLAGTDMKSVRPPITRGRAGAFGSAYATLPLKGEVTAEIIDAGLQKLEAEFQDKTYADLADTVSKTGITFHVENS